MLILQNTVLVPPVKFSCTFYLSCISTAISRQDDNLNIPKNHVSGGYAVHLPTRSMPFLASVTFKSIHIFITTHALQLTAYLYSSSDIFKTSWSSTFSNKQKFYLLAANKQQRKHSYIFLGSCFLPWHGSPFKSKVLLSNRLQHSPISFAFSGMFLHINLQKSGQGFLPVFHSIFIYTATFITYKLQT